jgi:ribosomal protein S18 acetylase RimI-like enzyme
MALGNDFDEICLLFERAIELLQADHIDKWDDSYPDRQILWDDIAKSQMFALTFEGRIAASVVLNEEPNDGYDNADWMDREGRPAVIHRLCVHPDFQNRGIGRLILSEAENYLADSGITSIRLDAFCENKKSLFMYERMGYSLRGRAVYRKGNFNLYERCI